MEAFMGWYSGSQFDSFLLWNRLHGPYRYVYLALLLCQYWHPAGLLAEEVPCLDFLALDHFFVVLVACGLSASLLSSSA